MQVNEVLNTIKSFEYLGQRKTCEITGSINTKVYEAFYKPMPELHHFDQDLAKAVVNVASSLTNNLDGPLFFQKHIHLNWTIGQGKPYYREKK